MQVKKGDKVDYHSIIGGPVTIPDCTVIVDPFEYGGYMCCSVDKKNCWVACDALTPVVPNGEKMDYWRECILAGLEEAQLSASEKQIDILVSAVEGGFENYSMAHGYDVIGNPVETQSKEELRELKAKIEKEENWKLSTRPCKRCNTEGTVSDSWGRNAICPDCGGKGRIPISF